MTTKRLYILFLLVFSLASAQQKQVQTSIDTTKNKIGAQFNLVLKTTVDTNSVVVFPKQKQFGPLEVIRSYNIDTVRKDNTYELTKRYGLTQFDSGKYVIPKLRILIGKKIVFSDSLLVEVTSVKVDTLKQKMYDIKDIVHSKKGLGNWWIYVLITLAIAVVGFFIYKFIKKNQGRKDQPEIFRTPIEKATGLLKQLEKKELWQKGEIKNYYSELTDIARNYIEEAIHIPAMESTTSELIAGLRMAAVKKNMSLTQETVENLERVLKQADLVKFAKSKPLDFQIAEDRSKIEKTILTLDRSIPEEIDEDQAEFNELQKQKLLKKRKRRRIIMTVGVVAFLLMATLIFFIATKGYAYVKDNLIGHPTKELLEGQWVASEYGNPAISIETPKVLKRIDTAKKLPKETMALMKEFQTFEYGTITDHFYASVSTLTYKAEQQIDLSKAKDGLLQSLELQGMSNILMKEEDFGTREGITGTKVFGTMTLKDPISGDNVKMYYEALFFGQQNGLQQVTVAHEDGDQYAKDIAKRILNSVELKKTAQ